MSEDRLTGRGILAMVIPLLALLPASIPLWLEFPRVLIATFSFMVIAPSVIFGGAGFGADARTGAAVTGGLISLPVLQLQMVTMGIGYADSGADRADPAVVTTVMGLLLVYAAAWVILAAIGRAIAALFAGRRTAEPPPEDDVAGGPDPRPAG